MVKSSSPLAVCSRAALGLLIAAGAAAAQSSSVVFEDLVHTPIGNATQRLDPDRGVLEVGTVDRSGADGVAVALGGTTTWSARLGATSYKGLPMNLSWGAFADGRRISTSTMRQSGSMFDIAAGFTGTANPTHAVHVYSDGQLIGSAGSQPSGSHILVPISFCRTFSEILDCGFTSDFHNYPDGECAWEFKWRAKVPIVLPNGATLTGNELRVVEELRSAGQYAYLKFDMMTLQTNAYALTFQSESAR